MAALQPWVALLGRVLMALIFLHGGIHKALTPAVTMAGFERLGLPVVPVAYGVTLAVEIAVAFAFLIGWKTRWSALILALWCIATALAAHRDIANPGQMIHLMKNVCMAGGFLQLCVFGPGRLSLDRQRRR